MPRHLSKLMLALCATLASCSEINQEITEQITETKSTMQDSTTETSGISFDLEPEEFESEIQDVNFP